MIDLKRTSNEKQTHAHKQQGKIKKKTHTQDA